MPRRSARVCGSRWRPTSPSVGAHLAEHLAESLTYVRATQKVNQKRTRSLSGNSQAPTWLIAWQRWGPGCHLADRLYARNQRILRKALEYPTEQQKDRESEVALASWLMALPWACHCLL